jgi:hypothetical protein
MLASRTIRTLTHCLLIVFTAAAVKPGQPLELREDEGPVSDDFTVVVAGSGRNGDVLRQRAYDGGSRGGDSGSDGGSSKSWVLASGGFEDADSSSN